jgi:hypothetical protein
MRVEGVNPPWQRSQSRVPPTTEERVVVLQDHRESVPEVVQRRQRTFADGNLED